MSDNRVLIRQEGETSLEGDPDSPGAYGHQEGLMSENEDEQSSSTRSEDIVPRSLKYWRFLQDDRSGLNWTDQDSSPSDKDRKTLLIPGARDDLMIDRFGGKSSGCGWKILRDLPENTSQVNRNLALFRCYGS